MVRLAVEDFQRRAGRVPTIHQRGPILLSDFYEELSVKHFEINNLTTAKIAESLLAHGYSRDVSQLNELITKNEKCEGFLFRSGNLAVAFVEGLDNIGRKRFTAAHELGHMVMHKEQMGEYLVEATSEKFKASGIEAQANQFAAELLMPEVIIRHRRGEMERTIGRLSDAVLAYRLSSELLVSHEAMLYRLDQLRKQS